MSREEELERNLKYYMIVSHSSFEWKALFKVPDLQGRVTTTVASFFQDILLLEVTCADPGDKFLTL